MIVIQEHYHDPRLYVEFPDQSDIEVWNWYADKFETEDLLVVQSD
jgi:hypothetical protein